MIPFRYERPADGDAAVRAIAAAGAGRYLGGGTNLVDLMRETIEKPDLLVDVSHLGTAIEARDDGGILIGAGAKNTAVAADRAVRERVPLLSRAILAGASAQIRNMASVGGNILQRTRCTYFYDDAARCNKREPGSGCDAIGGFNRNHAVLGGSDHCVATHPSDMCIALVALDAIVHLRGRDGATRTIPLTDLHRLPGDTPERETNLSPGELITAVEIPPMPFGRRSSYRKVRDRASYAFALVSVAAALDTDEGGAVRDVRLAFGGIGTKPWRAFKAEAALKGGPPSPERVRAAVEAEMADAKALSDNSFKIPLAIRTASAVLADLAELRS